MVREGEAASLSPLRIGRSNLGKYSPIFIRSLCRYPVSMKLPRATILETGKVRQVNYESENPDLRIVNLR